MVQLVPNITEFEFKSVPLTQYKISGKVDNDWVFIYVYFVLSAFVSMRKKMYIFLEAMFVVFTIISLEFD